MKYILISIGVILAAIIRHVYLIREMRGRNYEFIELVYYKSPLGFAYFDDPNDFRKATGEYEKDGNELADYLLAHAFKTIILCEIPKQPDDDFLLVNLVDRLGCNHKNGTNSAGFVAHIHKKNIIHREKAHLSKIFGLHRARKERKLRTCVMFEM
jgi:hypothetical protein